MSDLNDIFNDDIDSEVDSAEETEQETDSQEESKEETDNKSDEVNKPKELEGEEQEKDETPASTEEKDTKSEPEESWTKTAVLDERRKRQELEKKIQELETKIAPKQIEQKAERPDVLDDQEGAFKHTELDFEEQLFQQRVDLTRDTMQDRHTDYSEMEEKFMELSEKDPFLAQKLREVPNPAKFAYETAKNHLDAIKFKDPSFKENLREELKKEILAELVKNQGFNSKQAPDVNIPDLSNRTSVESNVTVTEKYKGTLDEVFGE